MEDDQMEDNLKMEDEQNRRKTKTTNMDRIIIQSLHNSLGLGLVKKFLWDRPLTPSDSKKII